MFANILSAFSDMFNFVNYVTCKRMFVLIHIFGRKLHIPLVFNLLF